MFEMKDVMKEIYDEFPEIEPSALDKICKDGLTSMMKYLRNRDDVRVITIAETPLIFYKPEPPKKAWERLSSNRYNDAEKAQLKEKLEHGETSE